jgi:hypothetical protein
MDEKQRAQKRLALRQKATGDIIAAAVEQGIPTARLLASLIGKGVVDAKDSLVTWEWLARTAREGHELAETGRAAGLTNDQVKNLL